MTITTPEALREAILAKLTYAVGRDVAHAHDHDWYVATALAVRDRAPGRHVRPPPRVRRPHADPVRQGRPNARAVVQVLDVEGRDSHGLRAPARPRSRRESHW